MMDEREQFEALSRQLKSSKTEERLKAVQALAGLKDMRGFGALLAAALDPDEDVAQMAAQGLAGMGEIGQGLILQLLEKNDEGAWNTCTVYLSEDSEASFWSGIVKRIQSDAGLLREARGRLRKQAEAPFVTSHGSHSNVSAKMFASNALARLESGRVAPRFCALPWGEPEWVSIPAGEFWMGGEGGEKKYEGKPVHRLTLPEFQMARVPVTNVQYALYVQDAKAVPPADWAGGAAPPGRDNHPVVNVSWDDALGYCAWLGQKIQKKVALPSEAEWEKAARGERDKRMYPWGNDWRVLCCNSGELGLGDTTPVDLFPQGASPYGLLDMCGNVWEWTRTAYGEGFHYPYNPLDGRENVKEDRNRILRGGSLGDNHEFSRCSARLRSFPGARNFTFGFRVVVS
jgi:formylglycine-generating enzyme required for sulfatase activity